jgi:zinc-ribbon domain/Phospholipase_D-nuclease N-terminal
MNKIMDVVPKGAKIGASIVMGLLILIGAVVGYCVSWTHHVPGGFMPAVGVAIGVGVGLLAGTFFAVWMLCLGYVYADAKRRGMRPVLWTLIAALFPHLFGFLLYFALRQSLGPKCPSCGQPVMPGQRFCSWCGSVGAASGGGTGAGPEGAGMGSVPTL